MHERALAATADSRDAREDAERDIDIDVAEVVLLRAFELQPSCGLPPLQGNGDAFFAGEVGGCQRAPACRGALPLGHLWDRPSKTNSPPFSPRPGPSSMT